MTITRRNFLRLSAASLLGACIAAPRSVSLAASQTGAPSPGTLLGRVTRSSIPVFEQPDMASMKLNKLQRDKVVILEEELGGLAGPESNPHWYRIKQGFIHSAYVQRIENIHIGEMFEIPRPGILGRVTVPFTQSWRINKYGHWRKVYRLYYDSLHWLTDITESPEEERMVQITDELLGVRYYAASNHFHPVDKTDFEPISPEVAEVDKKIIVSLGNQTLTALEAGEIVFRCKISSGSRYTETPAGQFSINRKYPSRHMGYGSLTSSISAYELPGVPWVSFFGDSGVAFHGTYWHDNFGNPMSKGCVNLRYEDARWVFRWTTPFYQEREGNLPAWKVESKTGVPVDVV